MKRRKKRFIFISTLFILLLLGVFIYNRVMLSKEQVLMEPLGSIVSVNNHNISIYTEGTGPKTLVFMSGGGTCSPILDFKSLYSCLSNDFRIVVVEKAGYGFSENVNVQRDISSILGDTRGALAAAGISGPFILCPHSMSGIEALYWAQKYPKEVEGIIGLDMATPYHYENLKIRMSLLHISSLFKKMGFVRIIPGIWKGDAVTNGTLSDKEKDIYRAVFYKMSFSKPMIKEAKMAKSNSAIVMEGGQPQIPLLMFVSNGKDTGMKAELWKKCSYDFIDKVNNGEIIDLDCPHYVHDYCYNEIGEEIRIFIGAL